MFIDNVPAVQGALKGQVAVITGAGRGIGREAARIMARIGASVVVAEINRSTGQETADLIKCEGGEALFVPVDVSDEASVAAMREQVLAAYGHVDILVNNAIVTTFGPLLEQSVAGWDRVMGVNLRGTFLCIKAFLPGMLERKSGVVMTIESSEGMPYLAPYLASKVALRSLALSLAQEVGEAGGVSVFCFGPGMVDTPGLAEALAALPPLYGMTRDEFIQQSGVSLVDPEVCATGLVGTVLYAKEFHGQQTGFGSGLGRLGLNVEGQPMEAGPSTVVAGGAGVVQAEGALALNRKLEGILQDNIREYSELTMFQRPLVKRMFQQGAGLKVEEWLAQAQAMTRQLEAGAGVSGQVGPYVASLQRLAQYIRKQESDARGYFKNQADLNRALQALEERHSVVAQLAAALEAL